MTRITLYVALGALAAAGLSAEPARAQTAYEINRLNQAVQICNSPMGASLAECAQLRARLGMVGGGSSGAIGFGGGAGKAAGIANLLASTLTAARSQQAAAAPLAAPAGPGAVQQAIATCVRNAGGNDDAIQACLRIADAGRAPSAAPKPSPFGSLLPQR